MRLGPEGFLFENYVGKILDFHGFKIIGIRNKVKGSCTTHEIDLIANSEGKKLMIECKHSSSRGSFIGLKVALYIHARFLDASPNFDGEVIVCNSKISQNAKKYSNCVGQMVFSWRYPPKNSLEKIIEESKLYPITILNLKPNEKEKFFKNNMILAKDLLTQNENILVRKTGIPIKRIRNLIQLTEKIIFDKE